MVSCDVLDHEVWHYLELHMYRVYGGWTFAFDDYTALNLTTYLDNDNMTLMANIIDPYGMYVCVCMHMIFFPGYTLYGLLKLVY